MSAAVSALHAGNVSIDVRNGIGHLTLNRPQGLNALTLSMVRTLRRQLDTWADDPDIVAVMLRGAGSKGFCAGGDLRMLCDSYTAGDSVHRDFFREEYALDLAIHRYRKPVVVLMDGYTLGAGMALAQAADLRIVTERSRIGMPEVTLGGFPDAGSSYFLSRLPGELGTYLAVSGHTIGAADALFCGLADWYLDSRKLAALDDRLDRLAFGTVPLKDLQGVLARFGTQILPDAPLKGLRPVIDHYFGLPDVPSMLEQLRAVSIGDSHDWALKTARLLDTHSPTAMAVALELIRYGRELSLETCFALELHLIEQWFEQGDALEGVRALLVDKDRAPRWNPPTLADLPAQRAQHFFEGFSPESRPWARHGGCW
ncbi:enoyl-CoA hydratase/isomerase family protein [Pseudomonas monteilii]|jgi:enoyl-CoA hydratase/carnithine racemase|uniref:enoyl-CoA hydratase/isomerase family protein n=1 Tax=Pseudomonas alabamensis TaxID=3064349 RepID=UPI0021DAA677|nr:enoyl-CoA hydratase/isomerase family protein [Pseudomonas entomophila]